MVDVKAYRVLNRLLVQFFDSGQRDTLCCPECGWQGRFDSSSAPPSSESIELNCEVCKNPVALLSSPMNFEPCLDLGISSML